MNSSHSQCLNTALKELAFSHGASAVGVARAEPVSDEVMEYYRKWIAQGCHGNMTYLDRYFELRQNPALLLPGARSIIIVAFNYYPRTFQRTEVPQFAYYAYGLDYHDVVRRRLEAVARTLESQFGGTTRVCVDTAPLFERYWAQKAGIGIRGLNSQLIIPGKGSYFFLGEILTTLELKADAPVEGDCGRCGACVSRCPAGAISRDGVVDASKCLSYLTIEYKGDFPEDTPLGNRIYGCDECQKACPHNRTAIPTDIEEFHPSEAFLSLDRNSIAALDTDGFNSVFRHSAVKRTKLAGLLRNERYLLRK